MDANGLRFWLLASEGDWIREGAPAPTWDPQRRTVRLGSHATLAFTEVPDQAELFWARSRSACDAVSTYAFIDPNTGDIRASGAILDAELADAPVIQPGSEITVVDFTIDGDGVLYMAGSGRVDIRDLRERWDVVGVEAAGFEPTRLSLHPDGGVWVLDRSHARVGRVRGLPLPHAGLREHGPRVFRPREQNPTPPLLQVLDHAFDVDEQPIDVASSSGGRTLVLTWHPTRGPAVRSLSADGLGPARVLAEVQRPYSIGWIDARTIAVLIAVTRPDPILGTPVFAADVVTYDVGPGNEAEVRHPLGGIYPLVSHDGAPLCRTLDEPARYARSPVGAAPPAEPMRLVRLSGVQRATSGTLRNAQTIDGGRENFVWHRIYVEAHVPPGCGARMWLAAGDEPTRPPQDQFFLHALGEFEAPAGTPRAVWTTVESELPFHPGVLPCASVPHRSGLFTVLIQRSGLRVTAMRGRYLFVDVELFGNGRASPELAALRIYGSRFSYVERYLPRIYREQLFEPDALAPVGPGQPPSRADFLDRFLCNFEGVLTVLEDRIANAHLLTDPDAAPDDALDWLGRWIGFVFDPAYPPEHRRAGLRHAMELNRYRGTLRGLTLALDIVTGGAVGRDVIVLEGWRLRRTFATILGADLADEHDPLLVGVVQSGNSIVGDSLILGDEFRREFLALFEETLPERPRGASFEEWVQWIYERHIDPHVVDTFFDRLAYRLTVLVHGEFDDDRVRLLRRVLELEAPAHLEWDIAKATHPFIVGLASLVGVDTYLREPAPRPGVHVDLSRIGGQGFLTRPPSLDPRLEGGSP